MAGTYAPGHAETSWIESGDPQLVMARWTGNYKHGNERTARSHPRNRG
ncbi:hypothetical protein AB0B50_24265 [Streptomyces sp. NPDC041068]